MSVNPDSENTYGIDQQMDGPFFALFWYSDRPSALHSFVIVSSRSGTDGLLFNLSSGVEFTDERIAQLRIPGEFQCLRFSMEKLRVE